MARAPRTIATLAAVSLISCSRVKPEVDIVPPAVVELLPRPEVGEATIRGIVVSDDHRTRVGGARISLEDSTTRVYSGNDGRFILPHVTAGRQVIHIRSFGYRRLDQVVEMPSAHGAAIVAWLAKDNMCLDYCPEPPPMRHSRLENVP